MRIGVGLWYLNVCYRVGYRLGLIHGGIGMRRILFNAWWRERPPMLGETYARHVATLAEQAERLQAERNHPLSAYPIELGAFRPESLN